MVDQDIKHEIIRRIRSRNPYRAFIFGSHAYGHPSADSDIDLLVVLDKEAPPRNFKEKSENYLEISRILRDIERKVPIDLIVYTRQEFDRFIQLDSQFARKILNEGEVIT